MLTYFFNIILTYLLMFINRKLLLFIWILFSISIIIYFLPTTGDDYNYYKGDYDSSWIDGVFPYFHSSYPLDAEPFYKFYTSFIKVSTGLPFNGFLVLNYILCSYLLFTIFKKIFNVEAIVIFFLLSLLTIVPTVYYFSPRSSISFIFSVYAFMYYVEEKTYKGLLYSFISIGFHSQFIPILFILFIVNIYNKLILNKVVNQRKYIIILILVVIIILTLILKFPLILYRILTIFIDSLPSGGIIEEKLHYFNVASSGVRFTSILSIFIFPFIFYISYKYNYFNKIFKRDMLLKYKYNFILFFGLIILFSLAVNILFYDIPHIASRISRFSDYMSMMILLGTLLLSIKNKIVFSPMLLSILALLVIFAYKTLYNFKLCIF